MWCPNQWNEGNDELKLPCSLRRGIWSIKTSGILAFNWIDNVNSIRVAKLRGTGWMFWCDSEGRVSGSVCRSDATLCGSFPPRNHWFRNIMLKISINADPKIPKTNVGRTNLVVVVRMRTGTSPPGFSDPTEEVTIKDSIPLSLLLLPLVRSSWARIANAFNNRS